MYSRNWRSRHVLQLLAALLLWAGWLQSGANGQGYWEIVKDNAGIATMHAAVTSFGNVILLDRTNVGDSQLPLNNGRCRQNEADRANKNDCTAHSAVFSPGSNNIRPLFVFTDTWCSSGQFNGDGKMVQTGGDAEGVAKIREYQPCGDDGGCDWVELDTSLQIGRWYASNQQLPDGTQIVVGGRNAFTVEYVPANGRGQTTLPLLQETNSAQNDNLYPFVHLLPNNNLFIFANKDSVLYDWQNNVVVKKLPQLAGEPRNYPSAGSSVMLPLKSDDGFKSCEVLVCGGAAEGAFSNPTALSPASNTCGRINPLGDGGWAIETMPHRRTMGDMILTPLGDVIIINGAARGSQGWGYASDPVLTPDLYSPDKAAGERFQTLAPSTIPRMYHSTSNLLPDGRILCAGSNTHQFYTFTGDFPTELRIDAYNPPYLGGTRPALEIPGAIAYGGAFTATVTYGGDFTVGIQLTMVNSPFVTHSYAQGQRLLKLAASVPVIVGGGKYTVDSTGPPDATIAPGGYYMLFAIVNGVPSWANWAKIG
ncbi:aldehyde oxidase GLOX [Physcomitrium patens]|uniref:Galactose oxidase-like Early set domain-containing protein n=1 Tax=Physcomitrium patens TaxID=3218 RepID=A9RQ58_PHYPA|nr:aldehyde oxidase GLOX-like [Physcomitrium patens]PNR62873.1 hypothetical protein PHYPA_001297 [Physcomitrium patens]|eukprot:XP_024385114.1 aldehyde oxidase GLOX-like [Physcomitrella patens]